MLRQRGYLTKFNDFVRFFCVFFYYNTFMGKLFDKKQMRVLVTGGLGFIGSRFVLFLLNNTKAYVKIVDRMSYAADVSRISKHLKEEHHGRFEITITDINNLKVADVEGYDYVVNFAAETHVQNSIECGEPFVESNVRGLYNMIEISRRSSTLKKFIQISTDEVYGDMEDRKGFVVADESFPLKPSSYYSATKAAGDMMVLAANRTYGLPFIITRCCNNFGPDQHSEKFLPIMADTIANGKPVTIHGRGTQSREWIHADDHASIVCELMLSTVVNEVFNIGTGYRYKNIDVMRMVGKALGVTVKPTYVADRLGQDKAYRLCNKKLTKLLGERIYLCLESFMEDEYGRVKQ